MKKHYKLYLIVWLAFLPLSRVVDGAILPTWNDIRAYRPVPPVFVHGFNSGPEAWGFKIDPETEKVIGYERTAMEFRKYFDDYLKQNPDTKEPLLYVEPFNYRYNTFDKMKWNADEGYEDSGAQYPDPRIIENAPGVERPTLRRYQEGGNIPNVSGFRVDITGILSKYQTDHDKIIAHSLGGPLSRWYLYKKGLELAGDGSPQGVNSDLYPVDQLVTLGSPHLGWELAPLANFITRQGWGDVTWGQYTKLLWRVGLHAIIFRGLPLERDVEMIDDMETKSEFLNEINTRNHIPPIKYSCMAGYIFDPRTVLYPRPFKTWTDSFLSVRSTWAARDDYTPPNCCIDFEYFEENQPKSILGPEYHAILIDMHRAGEFPVWTRCKSCQHTELPNWWELVLKEIDSAGRVEITEPKAGFMPPEQGELVVKGKVYDEYLPADCKVELKVLLEGEMEGRIIENPNPESGEQSWVWRLQPTDLWRADEPNSPVAEFEIRIPEEYATKTEKVKITVNNPAGYTYEDEVGWNFLIVDEVTKEVYCLDGPETMRTNSPKVVNEFRLIDEEGNKIESRPLGVAWDDSLGIFYVSFDDYKIRAYNEYGELVKTNSGKGYMEVPDMPDGLGNPYYYGWVWYVSEVPSIFQFIDYFNERIYPGNEIHLSTPLEEPGDYWSLVKGNPTDGVLEYHPHYGVLLWYSSKEFGLVRGVSGYVTSNSVQLGFNPTGLVQRGAYFYLISSDGRLYKKYCKSAQENVTVRRFSEGSDGQYDDTISWYSTLYSDYGDAMARGGPRRSRSFVRFDLSELPDNFYTVKIPMMIFLSGIEEIPVNVYLDITEPGWNYNHISWTNQPDILEPLIHLTFPPVYYGAQNWDEMVIDVTEVVRERLASGEETLDLRCKVEEIGRWVWVWIFLGPMYVEETTWAIDLPTDAPSDLGLGGKLSMRIKPGYPTSVNVGDTIQFEAHGKEPLEWESSDETVGMVDDNGEFTAVDSGSCKIKVTDGLGNIAESLTIMVE